MTRGPGEPSSPPSTPTILARFDRHVLLATGTSIHVRASRPSDVAGMQAFYDGLSDRSAYFRFFGLRPARLDGLLHPADGQDVRRRVVLLALLAGEVIGIGEYYGVPGQPEAEAAFAVADDHQHEGIATVLVEDLAMIATEAGLAKLVAETMATNEAMLDVFRYVGLDHHSRYESGQVHVELALTGESLLEERSDSRDWRAAVASLTPVLQPRHVVVFGAGRHEPSYGRTILDHLAAGFSGRVSAIHPEADYIGGHPAVAHLADLDSAPDLAVVSVPAANVPAVVNECGQAGVKAAVIVSAGFAEAGVDGVGREREVLALARRYGMRIVGPNSLGVMTAAAGLNATALRQSLPPGPIAIASQTGGVGVVLVDAAARRGLGASAFVSLGNKADVSGNDLLRYWCDDASTSVVLMHLESIGDPRRFARIARAVAKQIPVVALKSGRAGAGRRGAGSPMAAMVTDDAAVDALFAHTGVVRAATLDQLLDVGVLLAGQSPPGGRRIALVGDASGPLVLAADSARARRLDLVELSAPLRAEISRIVPGAAAVHNPVVVPALGPPTTLREVVEVLAGSGEVDACVVVTVHRGPEGEAPARPLDVPSGVAAVAVALGGAVVEGTIPTCPTPERAVDAMALAAARGQWLATDAEESRAPEIGDLVALRRRVREHAIDTVREHAIDTVREHAGDEPRWLGPVESFTLLESIGVPLASWRVAASAAGAGRAATEVGLPCVVKAHVAGVVHKAEEGAVVLDVGSPAAARRAFSHLAERFGALLDQVVVQRQAAAGVELLIGGVRDDALGPLVVVAAGGVDAEVLADRTVTLAPVTTRQATDALTALRIFPLLSGFRGRSLVPLAPIVSAIERVGVLLAAVAEIAEIELNPTIAGPQGCVVVDARIAVSSAPAGPLRTLR